MRIRCSRGLRISHFYGHFFTRSTDLLSLPNVDCDKAFSVQIAHEENLLNSTVAFIQCALLYTTTSGERRIRVHTHPLPVSGDLSDVFKSADMDAMMNLISKRALEVALSSKLQDARSNLEEKCFNILRSYRSLYTQHFKTTNELVLPDSLKLLPLYMNSMVKSVVFRGGTDVRPDERAYYISRLETMPASVSATFFYPRLFALHNLPPDVGLPGSDGQTVMPSALHLSAEKLEADGCYLLDNGLVLYFWISRSVSSEFLQHVLGLESVENVDMSLVKLLPYETDLSVRIRAIVDAIRKNQGLYQPLYFMKQGDPLEGRFFAHLVEDRTMTAMSYLEFLVHSHQQVLSKVP